MVHLRPVKRAGNAGPLFFFFFFFFLMRASRVCVPLQQFLSHTPPPNPHDPRSAMLVRQFLSHTPPPNPPDPRSAGQPWCDGSHAGTPFEPMAWTVPKTQTMFSICGCKRTADPPFCDGSHVRPRFSILPCRLGPALALCCGRSHSADTDVTLAATTHVQHKNRNTLGGHSV